MRRAPAVGEARGPGEFVRIHAMVKYANAAAFADRAQFADVAHHIRCNVHPRLKFRALGR